ncbi:Aquaporin SIP1-1 [Chlorella vulgaris]
MPAASDRASIRSKAVCDAAVSGVFVLGAASSVELSKQISPVLGLSQGGAGLALTILLLVGLAPVCDRLGGALFNPANSAMLLAVGNGSLREHFIRSVAQALGGVVGLLAATALLPVGWTTELASMAVGLRPGVGLLAGAACEFTLGAILSFVVLWSGQLKNGVLRLWVPLLATVVAVKAGADTSGPSLNPAFTFAFVFLYPLQTPLEHLFVYWVAPIAAAAFGGLAFRGYQQLCAEREQRQATARQRQSRRKED